MLRQKITAFIRLFRPELPAAAGICVLIGQIIAAEGFPPIEKMLLGFFAVFALSGSALILNDLFDLEVDRINAPQRPLPAGLVTPREVTLLAAATTLAGLAAAYALGLPVLLLSIPIALIGFLYNWRFKQSGLPGNLMVSTSVASTFLFGALSVGALWTGIVWVFSLMAFFLDLGEEIAADAFDMQGDRMRGSRSIAIRKGKAFALRLSLLAFAAFIALSYVPVLLGWLGLAYAVVITITNALVAGFAVQMLRSPQERDARRSMRGIYISASLGMVALLLILILQ